MARNLSALITDAFAIYSEAYIKIGQLGSKVVDLNGQPRQPAKIKQLIESTMLYKIVSDSINLNDAGTAIEGVIGQVATMNNLLLQLKRSIGLNSIPLFPTPLTVFTEIGGGAPGGSSVLESVDASEDPLVFDFGNNSSDVYFLADGPIDEAKTWSIINFIGARRAYFNFSVAGIIEDASHDQTMPSNVKMNDARVISTGPNVWRPMEEGEYQAVFTSYDSGLTWKLEISGDVFT
jgi:hypothetical protein